MRERAPSDGAAERPDGSAASDATSAPALELTARGAAPGDADRAVARLDPEDLAALGARPGDLLRLRGRDGGEGGDPGPETFARALPSPSDLRGGRRIALDELQRAKLDVALGDPIRVSRAEGRAAERVVLKLAAPRGRAAPSANIGLADRLRSALADLPVAPGDRLRTGQAGGRMLEAEVLETTPAAPALIGAATAIDLQTAEAAPVDGAYAEIGGLGAQIALIREMIELPLRRPDLFERLALTPPRGVLFTGPPGCGKTLLARAVARESKAAFFQISGPEIVSKHYGDSEGRLRELFRKAAAKRPAIIFIDEIDAIAPQRDGMAGDRQLERRVVAQLLTLMDGLAERDGVVVMAATNLPDSLDPALRRPGRFDRELAFTPPDKTARGEILAVHLADSPLARDVDLTRIAAATHGFVGADLAALAREAGLAALRRLRGPDGGYPTDPARIEIAHADFEAALTMVGPSAARAFATETPDVRWSDVGGAEEAKQALIEAVIWPLRHGAAFAKLRLEPARGVLLAGPPGCGKTHLARALAREARVPFLTARAAQLLSRHFGDSERAVRDLFAIARRSAPCILFFDEIDALAPPRGAADGGAANRVVAQLLTEMDGMEARRGVFLLAATNRVDRIDPALIRPGRFDLVLEIGAPNAAVRRDILEIHARGLPLAADASLDAWAARTEGLVGADLEALCATAGRHALRRWVAARGDLGAEDAGDGETGAEAPSDEALAGLSVTAADFEHAYRVTAASDAVRGRGEGERT